MCVRWACKTPNKTEFLFLASKDLFYFLLSYYIISFFNFIYYYLFIFSFVFFCYLFLSLFPYFIICLFFIFIFHEFNNYQKYRSSTKIDNF